MSKHRVIRIVLSFWLAVFAFAVHAEDRVAIVNVHVIPMDTERVLEDQTVLVIGGRIEAIGPTDALQIPDTADRIDGRGGYLIPGLTEMHAHVPPDESTVARDRVFELFVANGVTTVRGMLGRPAHLQWRTELSAGELFGPRLITSGPSFNGNSVRSPEHAEQMVRAQAAAGYDFLKLHPGLTRAQFDRIAETSYVVDIPFAGHVSTDVGLARALEVEQATIDHLDGYMQALIPDGDSPGAGGFFGADLIDQVDASRIPTIARETASAGVWNVPTQSLIEHIVLPIDPETMRNWPEMRYMPEATVAQWVERKSNVLASVQYDPQGAKRFVDTRRQLIKALDESGAGLLLGSDAPQVFNVPGFSLHRELAILVEAGLTPYAALRSGTANPAEFFGVEEFGIIEAGRSADMILLGANPFEDIRNTTRIVGVMLRGQWLSRGALDELLAKNAQTD